MEKERRWEGELNSELGMRNTEREKKEAGEAGKLKAEVGSWEGGKVEKKEDEKVGR